MRDTAMDRAWFVEFVQRTFVEQKTKGSKVVTRSQSVEITAYLHWNATRDPWITHEIHGLSCEVQTHGLHSAIRGLRKSILCAQHIYILYLMMQFIAVLYGTCIIYILYLMMQSIAVLYHGTIWYMYYIYTVSYDAVHCCTIWYMYYIYTVSYDAVHCCTISWYYMVHVLYIYCIL